jgi:potassium-dependent mechanosensitive channel
VTRYLFVLVVVLSTLWISAATAEDDLVASTEAAVAGVMQDLPAHENDFEGLLALRDRIEPYRNLLRTRLKELEPRKAELQREIAQLGPKSAADETPQLAALRQRLASEQESFETMYRQNLLASQQSEALWDRITEMRRVLFSTRLTMHVSSIVDPIFWKELIEFQIPWFGVRTQRLFDRWGEHIRANNNLGSAIGLLTSSAVLVVFFIWLHNVLTSRRRAAEVKHGAITELDVIKRGSLLLLMRAAPLTLAMLLFNLLVRRLDVAPSDVDNFLLSIAVAIFVMSATRGVMGALLSPMDPQWRLLRARDDTAKIISRMVVGSVDLYTLGIVLTSYQRLVEARVPIAIFTIIVITTAMLTLAVHGFRQLGKGSAPVHGFIEIRMGWVRPIIVVGCAACGLALLFGYVALAGFMSGRITISAASVAVAILVVASLNYLLEQELLGETKWGGAFAESVGVSRRTLDLTATALSGVLRFIIIVVVGLIVFMPWGLEYGDVNPFADFSTFVTTSDLRNWLGSFGFGLLAFVVGLLGTRLIVGWLDSALLPRMSLDSGIRHSIRTVLGYAGFAATAFVALSLMGVNTQNVAVVAGALSVGIGFGLQSIVSNFVSGLVLLAERPVRVGDVVVVNGEEGRVERISVRATQIETLEKSTLIVPNSELITTMVRNRTLVDQTQQLRFSLVLDYDADADAAQELLMSVIRHHPNVLEAPEPCVLFMRATEYGQEFEIRCNIDLFDKMAQTRSDLHHEIMRVFKANDIHLARIPAWLAGIAPPVKKGAGASRARADVSS